MNSLLTPLSYALMIVLGYVLTRMGFFAPGAHRVFAKVMINITLPCAIVQAFAGLSRDPALLWIVVIGLVCSLLPLLVTYLHSGKTPHALRTYRVFSAGGYNIGCFSLPLVQAFFGSTGAAVTCLFDTGNAIVMTGVAYALTSSLMQTGEPQHETPRTIALKFLKSAPFDVYMVLILLLLLGINVPEPVLTLLRPAGQANGFLAMLMIGMMFQPPADRSKLGEVARLLALRYAFAIVVSVLLYLFLPFSNEIRSALVVICFSPISSLSLVYTEMCDGDTALAGLANSSSVACSLVCMLLLSVLLPR